MVAGNSELFSSEFTSQVYCTGSFNDGAYGFRLSNNGETILLKNNSGELEDLVQYDDQAPWPEAANGTGPSLQLIAPDLENNHYANWFVSNGQLSSPGAANGGNNTNDNEILPEEIIQIFPNPVGEQLFLEYNEKPGARIELGIYTLTGTRISSKTIQAGGGQEQTAWQHQINAHGAYILRAVVLHPSYRKDQSMLLIFAGSL